MRSGSPKKLTHGRRERWDVEGVMLPEELLRGRVAWGELFGRDGPVEIEIGSGKGTFLLDQASRRPETNFVGIEYAKAYAGYTADRVKRAGLENVRVVSGEAMTFLRTCVPDGSVWRVHVYFPDPWPKRRHHRRRLVQPPFVDEAVRLLRPGGQLLVVTDHMGYFEQIRRVLADVPGLANIEFPDTFGGEGELVGTNFERKYIAQGRPFYSIARLRYRMAGGPSDSM